jgi:hypothetical protein
MTRAKTPAPKRTARKTPSAARAVTPAAPEILSPRAKQKARSQLPSNPVAAKVVDKDLAQARARVKAARTPIAKNHTQRVLDKKLRTYGRKAGGRAG